MASSQVQFAPLAPFGGVLKDHSGRRDGYGEPDKASMTNQDTFHRKLKTLVRDHLPTIMSDTGKEPQRKNDRIDPWFVNEQRSGRDRSPVKRGGECSTLTPTQARIVDRWAAQQAREMVSTIEKHAQVANHLCRSHPQPAMAPAFVGETSPSQSSDNSTKGASSLVQMWEARLSQPTGSNNNTNSPRCCSRSNSSALSCPENVLNYPQEEPLANVEGVRQFNEDFTADWESDGTIAPKDPSPTLKGPSSSSDSERGRVANIIKRLTSKGDQNDNEPSSPATDSPHRERERSSPNDHAVVGQKPFLQVTSSPRIRGRQAFSDLLMQMERERHKELESLSDRQVVSRFSQKGRIQAHLKLKILQRGVAAREQHPLTLFHVSSRGSASNGPSIIPQLREKSKTEAELDLTDHNGIADLEAYPHPIISITSPMVNTSTADWPSEETNQEGGRKLDHHLEFPVPSPVKSIGSKDDEKLGARMSDTIGKDDGNSDARTSDIVGKDDQNSDERSSDSMDKDDRNSDARTLDIMGNDDENVDARTSDNMGKDDRNSDSGTSDTMGEIVSYDDPNLERQQSMDACSSSSFWFEEEQGSNDEQPEESNYNWISRISRPRSYWEDRRQSWYQEMLEQDSTKEDIRQLLQRRRVSNFLSSNFLEMMNELMLRKQTNILALPEDDQIDLDFRISPIPHTHDHSTSHQEEVGCDQPVQAREEEAFQVEDNECQDVAQVTDGDRNEAEQETVEEEDEGSDDQYRDASDHSHQSPLSSQSSAESPRRSWGFDDDDDQVASMSSAQSPRSQAYYMDPLQHTRSMDHLSMEIELINELRGQMKQLQREMSKLRRSIKTCMDMQAPVHYSMKQDICPSATGDGRKSGSCSICYDKPEDSLLYRCGHMCTCRKCAVKLQFGSGKCPTCRGPIKDVVRAYPGS